MAPGSGAGIENVTPRAGSHEFPDDGTFEGDKRIVKSVVGGRPQLVAGDEVKLVHPDAVLGERSVVVAVEVQNHRPYSVDAIVDTRVIAAED